MKGTAYAHGSGLRCALVLAGILTHSVAWGQFTFPIHGPGDESRAMIRTDEAGGAYLLGRITDPVDFDPGPGISVHPPAVEGEAYALAAYHANGIFRWSRFLYPTAITNYSYSDHADAPAYTNDWPFTTQASGLGDWFLISISPGGSSGFHDVETASPLTGTQSWRITCSNNFYGIGRWLYDTNSGANGFHEGRINVLTRHVMEPTGAFNGFNLTQSTSSLSFGNPLEVISFSMNQANRITVTVDFIYQHELFPTTENDLRGDLLEYIIDLLPDGYIGIEIINHSESGSPRAVTNVLSQKLAAQNPPPLRTIRFGSFLADTNQHVVFDGLRVLTNTPVSTLNDVGLSVTGPDQIWVHGRFRGILNTAGGTGDTSLVSVGRANGFAIAFDEEGTWTQSHQATATGATAFASIGNVMASGTNLLMHGLMQSHLSLGGSNLIQLGTSTNPMVWEALLDPQTQITRIEQITFNEGPHELRGARTLTPESEAMLYEFANDIEVKRGELQSPSFLADGERDLLIAQLTESTIYALSFGGGGDDIAGADAFASDADGRLYVGGNFHEDISYSRYMAPDPEDPFNYVDVVTNLSPLGGFDMFIACVEFRQIDPDIRPDPFLEVQWARALGGAETNMLHTLMVDAQTNILVAGFFRGVMEMDGIDGSYTLSSVATNTGMDGFIAHYDASGSFRWAHRISGLSGTGEVMVTSAALDPWGRALLVGSYDEDTAIELPNASLTLPHAGASDLFVLQVEADASLAGPRLSLGLEPNNQIRVTVGNRAGVDVQLERRGQPGWTNLVETTEATGSVSTVIASPESTDQFRATVIW